MNSNAGKKPPQSSSIGSSHHYAERSNASAVPLTDQELWKTFKKGDEASFIRMYKDNFPALFQYGRQFSSNVQLVEDAIQDVFVTIREKRQSIDIKSSIKFYLFKSFKNKLLRLLNEQGKNEGFNSDLDMDRFEVSFSVEQKLINSQLEKEQRIKLNTAIKKLTPRQREAIYYFYYENLSYAEIQELMDFNQIQGIRNLIYRSLSQLKSYMN